jgi:hypothetical protein
MAKLADTLLPEQFRDLERFATDWSIERESDRSEKRLASSMTEISRFYDAIMPRMDAILAYLNQLPLNALPDDARRLLWLTLSLAEISPAIHFYGQPTVIDGFDARQFQPVSVPHFTLPGD